jgi:hypothetical protein
VQRDRGDRDELSRFFGRAARAAYGELGLRDDAVVGYVADLLARFARTDVLYRLRDPAGRRLDTVVEMLLELARPEAWPAGVERVHPDREREIRRHVGDYALFMSGLFPEHVARRGGLGYYHEQGRRAYAAVFEHDRARYRAGAALFGALAADFPRHAGALTYMRQVHFRRHAAVDRLLSTFDG